MSVNATSGIHSTNPLGLMSSTPNKGASINSFAQQLATTIEGYLGNVKSGSHFEIDVQSGQGQSFTVTVKDLGASTPAAPVLPSKPTIPVMAPPTPMVTPVVTPTATPSVLAKSMAVLDKSPAVLDKSEMTPTEAYWAEQPVAVQALQDMPGDQRFAAAQDLAKQGYTIDVPIMVWGWDPLVTMTLRQNEGYTWVPSGLQPNIPIGPGVANVWNRPAYNANNPPPGSIMVSTDFAKGSNGLDPWIHGSNT
jgi:hypothetical protein